MAPLFLARVASRMSVSDLLSRLEEADHPDEFHAFEIGLGRATRDVDPHELLRESRARSGAVKTTLLKVLTGYSSNDALYDEVMERADPQELGLLFLSPDAVIAPLRAGTVRALSESARQRMVAGPAATADMYFAIANRLTEFNSVAQETHGMRTELSDWVRRAPPENRERVRRLLRRDPDLVEHYAHLLK